MKKAALLLCTLLLAALAGCQLGGKAIILPKAGNITAIQVETLEGESLSLTQEAVSYTHLDVYKRQGISMVKVADWASWPWRL